MARTILNSKFAIRYSLFAIRYSLFAIRGPERGARTSSAPRPHPLLRNHQLHPSVLLPAGRGLVRGDRLRVALADGGDAVGGDARAHEKVAHRLGALLRERLVLG